MQLFKQQFKAIFLKRWFSFKRDWRMWLIMVLPSILISAFLLIGFTKEYQPKTGMSASNILMGGSDLSNPEAVNSAITNLSTLTNHGQSMFSSFNVSRLGEKYFKDVVENPSLENVMKTLTNFQSNDNEDEDPEVKELQGLVKEVMDEDLEIKSGFDLMAFGLKMASGQKEGMNEAMDKIQHRIQDFYMKKMKPVMRDVIREQGELMMVEGIRYMKEIIYLIWIVFSLSQCSGIAIEAPVMERESRIRYHLNVLGMGQVAYWAGNFTFDLLCFLFQAVLMVGLIYPLHLHTFQKEVKAMILLMAAFGPAHTLFSYLLSFGFKKPQNALKFISIIYFIAGFVIPFILKLLSIGLERCDGYTYTLTQIVS
mmetsp:Transcript_3730/g.5633  ORF Transcript_3730/g.5633 Transcript_3730/m.5633 type:complete len:368 (-) Transcript_3730:1301-2404(-)